MIHIGIIGLGAIGQRLIKQFTEHDEVTIIAVCDRNESLARETSEQLGNVQANTDYKQLLANTEVDLVYVADAAKEAGIVHAMNFPLNYGQAATKFAESMNENYIGKLRRLQLSMHFPEWPRVWQKNDWVGGREQGGFVLEVGVHFIQQTLKLFGDLHNIQTRLEFPEDPTLCETGIIATAELSDGTPVLIEGISGQAGKEHIGFTAVGSEGVLSLENWGELWGGKTGGNLEPISLEEVTTRRLINELLKAVNGQEADLYDFEVGYQAQKVLEELRKGK